MAKRAVRSVVQIHLPERWPDPAGLDEPPVRWALRRAFRSEDGVSHVRDIPQADEVIVVVPVARVFFTRASLPPGPPAKTAKLVAFAVEESIALAPEDIHAVALDNATEGERLIGVIDRAWLDSALTELASAELPADRVIVESALVGGQPGVWSIVWSGDGGFAVLGGLEAIALDASIDGRPPLSLKLAADERRSRGEPLQSVRVLLAGNAEPPDTARWSQSLHVPVTVAGRWLPEEVDARSVACPDLRPGAISAKWASDEWLGRFKPAFILGGAVVAAHIALTVVDWGRLWYEARSLRGDMEANFRKAFPEAKTVVDPALQMSRNVADLRRAAGQPDTSDLLPLLAQLTPALASASAKPAALKYERGELELELAVASGVTRESLAAGLKAPGLTVRVDRVTAGPTGTIATVKVAAEGG
jgi:general secretion pathway protein L